MIKNVVFDLGGVLLDYHVSHYLTHIGLSEEEIKQYKPLIWQSEEWQEGDAGLLSYEEVTDKLCHKYPEYPKMRYILENKDNDLLLSANNENINYVKELKDKGFKIYFLSNVSKWDLEYDKNKFDLFELADGAIYSCDIFRVKPSIDCYQALFNQYHLVPQECIFIDDNLANVEAANSLGVHGILYSCLEDTKAKIEELIHLSN